MPEYIYLCHNGHSLSMNVRMFYTTGVMCECGLEMWRKPQRVSVNWNGLRPSQGELAPAIKGLVDENNIAERRDKYWELKDARKQANIG